MNHQALGNRGTVFVIEVRTVGGVPHVSVSVRLWGIDVVGPCGVRPMVFSNILQTVGGFMRVDCQSCLGFG
jgi:hypothetical protein